MEQLDLEETLLYDRQQFHRIQKSIRVIKLIFVISLIVVTFGLAVGIVSTLGQMNEIRYFGKVRKATDQVIEEVMRLGFNLLLITFQLLFNITGFVAIIGESFTLTGLFAFGTSLNFGLSFVDSLPIPWNVWLRVVLLYLALISLLFFFLMRKRRVSRF